jgi:hypothetical protein
VKDLITDRIFKADEGPFSDADLFILQAKRKKQMRILYSGFFPLAAALLYVFIDGISVINARSMHKLEFKGEAKANYQAVLPYVCGAMLLMLIGYFIYYYITTLGPIIKDLKKKKKVLAHFVPEKTEMALFKRYYISTPVLKQRQVRVSYEDFCMIADGNPIILELAPYSRTILRFTCNGKEIIVS